MAQVHDDQWTIGRVTACYIFLLLSLGYSADADTCQWTAEAGKRGGVSDGTRVVDPKGPIVTQDQCRTFCEDDPNCLHISFKFLFCYTFTVDPQVFDESGYTHDTCTRAPPSCSLTDAANTRVSGVSARMEVQLDQLSSEEQCSAMCTAFQQCVALTYDSSSCILHMSAVTGTTQENGYTYLVKCSQLDDCCFKAPSSNTKGDSSSKMTLTTSVASCQLLCLESSDCVAMEHHGQNCYFYPTVGTNESANGYTLYKRSCPAGATPGSWTIGLSSCNSSASAAASYMLLLGSAVAWFALWRQLYQ